MLKSDDYGAPNEADDRSSAAGDNQVTAKQKMKAGGNETIWSSFKEHQRQLGRLIFDGSLLIILWKINDLPGVIVIVNQEFIVCLGTKCEDFMRIDFQL